MAFEGFGLIGYDNLARKHIYLWTDNFLTGVIVAEGPCNASGTEVTLTAEFANPKRGGAKTRERWVNRMINSDKFIFEMWERGEDNKEYLHGEITYTRLK